MSALQKISSQMTLIPNQDLRQVEGMSAFFIIPARAKGAMAELFMDHPPLEKRIAALAEIAREMGRPVAGSTLALQRRFSTRDFGLTLRMVILVLGVVALYVLIAAGLVLLAMVEPTWITYIVLLTIIVVGATISRYGTASGLMLGAVEHGRRSPARCHLWVVATGRARFAVFADHPPLEERLARLEEMSRAMGEPDGG